MTESAPEKVKFKKPIALVAGGAGFLGSHLVSTLIAQNFQVICVDNLSTGKKDNIKSFLTNPNFTFIEANINSPSFTLPPELSIDYCFHLASIENYKADQALSLDTLLVNSLGTKQLLEISKENKAKFILVSSADLYSGAISSSSLRFYFGKNPTEESIYSVQEAKRFAEALTFEYYKNFKLDVTVVRLKDVYGPKMNLDRGDEIADLINEALHSDQLTLYGDGLKIVNPTYVSDVVFALVKAAVGTYNGEIFILVNPEKVTVESFAQTLKLIAGPVEIVFKKSADGNEIPSLHLNLDNTKEKLGFLPKVTLAEGLGSVVQYYRLESNPNRKETTIEPLQVQQAISLTSEDKIQERKVTKSQKKGIQWIRIAVFSTSFLLLLVTVVYPLGGVGVKGYLAKRALTEASLNLNQDKTVLATQKANSAEETFRSAQNDLQNVSWLLKIIGLNQKSSSLDHLYASSETLAQAIRNSAQADQILIDATKDDSLTLSSVKERLTNALEQLKSSQEKIAGVNLTLSNLNWSDIPSTIAPDKDFMTNQTIFLEAQVVKLIAAIDAVLQPRL